MLRVHARLPHPHGHRGNRRAYAESQPTAEVSNAASDNRKLRSDMAIAVCSESLTVRARTARGKTEALAKCTKDELFLGLKQRYSKCDLEDDP